MWFAIELYQETVVAVFAMVAYTAFALCKRVMKDMALFTSVF